ncbi:hypothetical protein BVG19_g3345 [[Candida] boidinii]|nr:hypothetical protein BVG19_g3345 [[Candida] boidinii]OWB53842.1 hydrolase activity protein [[Candida] boidinii]
MGSKKRSYDSDAEEHHIKKKSKSSSKKDHSSRKSSKEKKVKSILKSKSKSKHKSKSDSKTKLKSHKKSTSKSKSNDDDDNDEDSDRESDLEDSSDDEHNQSEDRILKTSSVTESTEDTKPISLTVPEILSLEHAITTLQQSIQKIVDDSPDINQLNKFIENFGRSNLTNEKDFTETIVILSRNQKIELSAKLKTLYNEKKLKLFDELLEFNENSEIKGIENTSLKLKRIMQETQNDVTDNININNIIDKGSNSDIAEKFDESNKDIQMRIPKYNPGKNYPPILPRIMDPVIESKVFMHKSKVNGSKYLSKEDMLHSHNERFEFLGDSILNNLITIMLYKNFPNANEGELSIMRSKLVNNAILSEWSQLYGFHKKLNAELSDNLKNGNLKIYADIFEAYIGGLIVDNSLNFENIRTWLYLLCAPIFKDFKSAKDIKDVDILNKNAKGELYALIGSASMPPKYISTECKDAGAEKLFKVECQINNEVIGVGIDLNIKDAGLRAANDALNNKTMIEKYSLIRLRTPRAHTLIPHNQQSNSESSGNDDSSKSNNSETDATENTTAGSSKEYGILDFQFAANSILHNKDETYLQEAELPIITPDVKDEFISKDSKNRLYAILSKNKILPIYRTEEIPNGFKTDLYINDVSLVTAIHINKKKSAEKCAMYLLSNPVLLKRAYVF